MNVSRFIIAIFIVLPICLLQGCAKKIEGEVFLVQPKGDAVKLASVKIYVIPEDIIKNLSKDVVTKYATFVDDTVKPLEEVNLQEDYSNYRAYSVEAIRKIGASCRYRPLCLLRMVEDKDEALKVKRSSIVKSLRTKLDVPAKKLKLISRGEIDSLFFLANAMNDYIGREGVIATDSNSDGSFNFEIKGSGKYTIVAIPQDVAKQRALWITRLNADDKKIKLTNENLYNSVCSNCVLSQETLEALIANEKRTSKWHSENNMIVRKIEDAMIEVYSEKEPEDSLTWLFEAASKLNMVKVDEPLSAGMFNGGLFH